MAWLLALPAHAAQTVWQGEAFLTAVTDSCTPNGVAVVGDFYRVVYRPKLAGTDPAEALSFVGSRSIFLATSQAGSAMLQGGGSYKGSYISSHATTGSTTGAFQLSVSPLPVLSGTDTVTISGTLTNFFGTTGCGVTFRSALSRRP